MPARAFSCSSRNRSALVFSAAIAARACHSLAGGVPEADGPGGGPVVVVVGNRRRPLGEQLDAGLLAHRVNGECVRRVAVSRWQMAGLRLGPLVERQAVAALLQGVQEVVALGGT